MLSDHTIDQLFPFSIKETNIEKVKYFPKKSFWEWIKANRKNRELLFNACRLRYSLSNKNESLSRARYRLKYPEKYNAEKILLRARQKGEIIQQPCIICGNIKSQAHHENYNKPLDIIWLCRKCHIALHTGELTLKKINGNI